MSAELLQLLPVSTFSVASRSLPPNETATKLPRFSFHWDTADISTAATSW